MLVDRTFSRATASLPLAALLSLLLAGCPQVPRVPLTDGGPGIDGSSALGDRDGDGVCDDTEARWGSDPGLTDTDGDGFDDRTEITLNFDPTRPDSPDRDRILFLVEQASAGVQLPVNVIVFGEGENFAGSFESFSVGDRLGIEARDFLRDAVALAAQPMQNVVQIIAEEQRFLGVSDRTALTFELRFEFGTNLPRSCLQAYPFRYDVRRSDGPFVGSESYALVIVPEGQRLDTASWCAPVGGCI